MKKATCITSMKYLSILLLFCLTTHAASAQEIILGIFPGKEGKITYTGVVYPDSIAKDELYRRAKQWFVNTYTSANAVLQMEDKDAGQIIGKGYFTSLWKLTFYANQAVDVYHTINIQMKDDKYRYEITDFRVKYDTEASQYISARHVDMPLEDWKMKGKNTDAFFVDVDSQVKEIISSINKAMNTKIDSEW